MSRIKLSEIQINLGVLIKIILAISVIVGTVFGAMNYYFLPRETYHKEISTVKEDVSTVKADVRWIRKVWEDGIQKAEVIK